MTDWPKWRVNESRQAFLVALDISGFSNDVDPDQLLTHRLTFFRAVEATPLFPETKAKGAIAVHFLGDELRLALPVEVGARDVRGFVDGIFHGLDRINQGEPERQRTRVKGVVLEGQVVWCTWWDCSFLDGELPFKAQAWMGYLGPGQVAADSRFKLSLQTAGIPVDFAERDFASDTSYLLRT